MTKKTPKQIKPVHTTLSSPKVNADQTIAPTVTSIWLSITIKVNRMNALDPPCFFTVNKTLNKVIAIPIIEPKVEVRMVDIILNEPNASVFIAVFVIAVTGVCNDFIIK